MTSPTHRIAVIPGDGIGTEVMPPAQRLLELAGKHFGFSFEWEEFEWGCEYYSRTGAMMPDDGLQQLAECDQILLGAVGFPVSYTHLRAHETVLDLVCRLLLEK